MPTLADKLEERLVDAYNRGDSVADICDQYQITTYKLYKALHSAQMKGNPVKWRYQNVTNEDVARVVELYNAGVKVKDLPERTGMSSLLIYQCLRDAERSGMEIRWRSTRVRGGASA